MAWAVPLQWNQVIYLPAGKLNVIDSPVPPPWPEFEFKGYDISKDKKLVAAGFARKGEQGPGTRRPSKGTGNGWNRAWHRELAAQAPATASAWKEKIFLRVTSLMQSAPRDLTAKCGRPRDGEEKRTLSLHVIGRQCRYM